MADAQTDTMPQSLVLIPPAIAIAVQVTCLGAVVFGCKGALKVCVKLPSAPLHRHPSSRDG